MTVIDPRWAMARERLRGVGRVFFVESSKGGVGKTVFSALLALVLAEKGVRVGLFDADFTNPGLHTVLGVEPVLEAIGEDKGVLPVEAGGVLFMSIAFYTGGRPLGLRGYEASSALVELLAVTRWGGIDALVVDTPPGIGDEHMDLHWLRPDTRVIAVSTPSRLAVESLIRLIEYLGSQGIRVAAVAENMSDKPSLRPLAEDRGIEYIGPLPYDPGLEQALGSPAGLRSTKPYRVLRRLVDRGLDTLGWWR